MENAIGKHLYNIESVNGRVYVSSESQGNTFIKEAALEQTNFSYKVQTGNVYITEISEETDENQEEDTDDTDNLSE